MRSALPKVLHQLNGQPLLAYPVNLAKRLKAKPIIAVIGYEAELVRQAFTHDTSLTFALQAEQLGTGHAVMSAMSSLEGFDGPVFICSGDVPGLKMETLQNMLQIHTSQKNALTVLGMRLDEPGAYGRMLVDGDKLVRIVEFRDATPAEKMVTLVNAGIYVAQAADLKANLPKLTTNNDQREYYVTDLIELMNGCGLQVGYAVCPDPLQVAGVNSQEELRELEQLLGRDK